MRGGFLVPWGSSVPTSSVPSSGSLGTGSLGGRSPILGYLLQRSSERSNPTCAEQGAYPQGYVNTECHRNPVYATKRVRWLFGDRLSDQGWACGDKRGFRRM
jgi:hypothetical protein